MVEIRPRHCSIACAPTPAVETMIVNLMERRMSRGSVASMYSDQIDRDENRRDAGGSKGLRVGTDDARRRSIPTVGGRLL
jgi:hypothetical protein